MINKCEIERKSFNGAPCGRSEPPGKAEMVEGGGREERRDGGGSHTEDHSFASDELQPSFSLHVG